jgi:putative ABC transport system substrate-binding protein
MLQDNLKKLRDGSIAVDAVYLPADSFLISNAKLLGTSLRDGRIKSIAAIDTYVDHGALLGLVPQYRELGRAAATIVHQHLNGRRLQDMPVLVDPDPVVKINSTTSRALGVTVPDAVRKRAVVVE